MPEPSRVGRRRPARARGAVGSTLIAIGLLVLTTLPFTGSARAAGVPSGAVTFFNASAVTSTPISSGGQNTLFGINLPTGAACSGDTASKGYHVFSYVVPGATDPGSLTFNVSGPSSGNPLMYGANAASDQQYIGQNTAPTTGQVIGLPTNFNFAPFDGSNASFGIPQLNGSYHVGIACADTLGNGDKYWDVLVNFGSSPTAATWWSVTSSGPGTTTTTAPTTTAPPASSTTVTTLNPTGTTTTIRTPGTVPATTDPASPPVALGETASRTATASGSPTLPRTGRDTVTPTVIGILFVYTGSLVLLLGRRHRLARI